MSGYYDALIVGGGPAGSTAAILLASAGWSVGLIEKQAFPRRKLCGGCVSASNLPLLSALGLGDSFAKLAGPELREVALYCGERSIRAPLPALPDGQNPWGKALTRGAFDRMLLDRAREVGADVYQPATMRRIDGDAGSFTCTIESHKDSARTLGSPVLILANGSWEPGIAQANVRKAASDLFAFGASFKHSSLAPGVLPVVSFQGGYGGLAIAEEGHLTFAGCIRRDVLKAWRTQSHVHSAGETFEGGVCARTTALREALDGSSRIGPWLAVGPIRPGVRGPFRRSDGAFLLGNAAAEAHPIIGEGISMALQSASMLCERLIDNGPTGSASTLARIGSSYAGAWRHCFASRMRIASLLAHAAMRPWLAPFAWPLLAGRPELMTALAHGAGKARLLESPREIMEYAR